MKIWLAPSAFFPHRGGVEELTLQLAQQLQDGGHDVVVVTNHYPLTLASHAIVDNVTVRRVEFTAPSARPAAVARFVATQHSIQTRLRAVAPQPDVIHIQCPTVQTAALMVYARRHHIPVVLTSQGEVVMDAHRLYERSAYMRMTFRLAARSAAALTACSEWTATQCRQYSARFATAAVIPNGVDPAQWELSPPIDRPILCAWGRHVHEKGFDLAIRAFAVLRQRLGDARFIIGGEGAETAGLRELAGEGVEFAGVLDRAEVRALLAKSRVAVVPSRVEPFGIVALEALAAGRGLVYAAGTGLVEAAGDLGRAVDVYDSSAFADAMEAELTQPTPPAAGRARAGELCWSTICERYLSVYRSVGA